MRVNMATKKQQDEFISKIAPLVVQCCVKRGWGIPSAIIAQAIIESNWGLSGLAKYNNMFGMKCGSSWKGTSVNMTTKEEYKVGTLTTIKDNFRTYKTLEEGVDGYFDFLSTSRYTPVRAAVNSDQYTQQLKNCGYATSSTYVNTLRTTIKAHNLGVYDSLNISSVSAEPTPEVNKAPVKYELGKTYTVRVNLNVRTAPMGTILKTYKVGTRVTCKEICDYCGVPWMRTPSGWICTKKGDKLYVS